MKEGELKFAQFLKRTVVLGDETELSIFLAKELEYYYLNQKYGLDSEVEELPICIVSPFRNFKKVQNSWRYFESINNQNYSNYKVVMSDDVSDDGSIEYIKQEITKYPRLNNRLLLLRNSEHVGALGNKDYGVRHRCQEGSIVLEIDSDDALIGTQVLNLYNRVYQG